MSVQIDDNQVYTIMEAAKLSGLPESTLRYYETIGLIEHIKRGETSKQREYTDDDINLVIGVACLSATGMSIEYMRTYLANRGKGAAVAAEQIQLLDRQRIRLLEEAHFMQLQQRYVGVKIDYWKAVGAGDEQLITKMKASADTIASELRLPRKT